MPDKFFGVWFKGTGWFRVLRTTDQVQVVWSTTERRFAVQKARELYGRVKRTDLALSEPDAEQQMLAAEARRATRVNIFEKVLNVIIKMPAMLSHPGK